MNEIELQHMGFHTLRQIARQIGVKAPTSLKKAELIQAIIRIKNGIDKPCFSNKGRPLIDVDIKYENINVRDLAKKEKEILKKAQILKDIKVEIKKLKILVDKFLKD